MRSGYLILILILASTCLSAQTFRKLYKGNVGPHAVTMTLSSTNGDLTGSYYYDKKSDSLSVHGFIAGKSIEISGYDANGVKQERFIGQISRFDIHGIWIGEELRNRYSFSLKEEIEFTPAIQSPKWGLYLGALLLAIGIVAGIYYLRSKKQTDTEGYNSALSKFGSSMASSDKGYEFEKYITDHLSPDFYKLLEWRSAKFRKPGITGERQPELEFERKNSPPGKNSFAIKCRYSANAVTNNIKLGLGKRNSEYKYSLKKSDKPMFVAIGLGGLPSDPEQLYIVPIEKIEGETINLSDIAEFRITGKHLNYDPEKKTLN